MYYSFDVFDTCLTRSCGHPTIVFDVLARLVLGEDAKPTKIADFSRERVEGEELARQHRLREDVSIEEIYECCDFSGFTDKSKTEIISLELFVEKKVLVPVSSIQEKIRNIRKKGNVVFVSDMYLPTGFLKEVLRENNFFREGDEIFVSGDVGLTKETGNLFKYIISTLNIRPNELMHFGDNPISDVKIPKQIGISVKRISHQYSEYERKLISKDFSPCQLESHILASIARSVRLSCPASAKEKVACDFVAALFVPYVYHILESARNNSISRVFFLARDATLFFDIANRVSKEFPDIEIKFLYVSRTSLYLPGLEEISFDAIKALFWNFSTVGAKDIFERLQIDNKVQEAIKIDDGNASSILQQLLDNQIFIDAIASKKREQKQLLTEYLIQEGVGEGNCAIIDFSGTRKCHCILNKILREAKQKEVFGYYFSVLRGRCATGEYESMFFEERREHNIRNLTLSPVDLLEQYFCASPYNRTISYHKEVGLIVPTFCQEPLQQQQKEIYEVNKRICLIFADHYAFLLHRTNHKSLTYAAASIFSYFRFVPTIDYLHAFDGYQVSDSAVNSQELIYHSNYFSSRKNIGQWEQAQYMRSSIFPNLTRKILLRDYNRVIESGKYISEIKVFWERVFRMLNNFQIILSFRWLNK